MTSSNKNLIDQAMFFCLVCNDSPLDRDTVRNDFNVVTKMMKGYRNIPLNMRIRDFIMNAVVAYQLSADPFLVVRAVNCILEKAEKVPVKKTQSQLAYNDVRDFCRKIAVEVPNFFVELVEHAKSVDAGWPKTNSDIIDKSGLLQIPISGELNRFNGVPISLLAVIKRHDNPFAHENASLALLIAIINGGEYSISPDLPPVWGVDEAELIDLSNCKVICSDWDNIQSLSTSVSIQSLSEKNPLFSIPKWIEVDHRPLYCLGTFLRSCIIGNVDWSAGRLKDSTSAGYTGVKTSFLKRQLGMMHSPEAMVGEGAPMSNWISSLLFNLLQWPGTHVHSGNYSWPNYWSVSSLREVLLLRLKYQKSMYCKMTGIPAYVEKLKLDWPTNKKSLKVVMVQSLLPLKKDFAVHGLMLDSAKYRARHRRHVASVAELVLHKAHSYRSADDLGHLDSTIDLIIWPELSVNNDDIDILKQLANKTGAIIFTGLTFMKLSGIDGPNNVAKWLIPQKLASGSHFINRLQGKHNMMKDEIGKVKPWRPYQLLIELVHPAFPEDRGFTLTGSICYDATDIKISADLKDKTDSYLVVALNQDVTTFDSMVDALYYHMYQHVTLVNTGEFGGSVAKAPYKERHEKLITHVHGAHQVSVSSFEMNMFDFRDVGTSYRSGKQLKTKPAGS
jgi:hypothetical protein